MKYMMLAWLFILHHLPVASQVDYTKTYYPVIHQADLKIVDGDYTKALSFYQKGFKESQGGFSVDFLNAAVCAVKTGNDKIAFKYLDSLIGKGVRKDFLETFVGLGPLRKNKRWGKYISQYDEKLKTLVGKRNDYVNRQITVMEDRDQEFRQKEGSYDVYGDTIEKIDKENVDIYIALIKKYGFPNENMLGVSRPASNIPGNIVLHHHCQAMSIKRETVKYDFTNDFINAVRKGQLEPHQMAFLIALQGKDALQLGGLGLTQLESNGTTSKLLRDKLQAGEEEKMNVKRFALGLELLDQYYIKSVYKLKNEAAKDFIFDKYGHLNIFSGLDESTYKALIQSFEPID